ncbi:MAG: substrate-binding domain-containing protein [Chloroflexi bacterium]|nr:substrate-binding domain-containing protein [Chloroflexota bacterium]
MSSSREASVGGLQALARGEAHVAGCHLLDPISGEYNTAAASRYTPGRRVALVNLSARVQGFIVARGNPKGIRSVADLARPDVTMINRQPGAGTRVLLDYWLAQAGLSPAALRGYEREEYNHLGVAAAVAGGQADAGMGIAASARAMGLDFVPLATERYDLAMPEEYLESALLAPLLTALKTPGFRDAAAAIGGYDTGQTGQVMALVGGPR